MSVAAHREMRHSSLAVLFFCNFLQVSGNHDMPMPRRDFLSASSALAVTPVFTGRVAMAAPLPREADIVVIGAGAAGIAAARRIMAANRKVIVGEAGGRSGGGRG